MICWSLEGEVTKEGRSAASRWKVTLSALARCSTIWSISRTSAFTSVIVRSDSTLLENFSRSWVIRLQRSTWSPILRAESMISNVFRGDALFRGQVQDPGPERLDNAQRVVEFVGDPGGHLSRRPSWSWPGAGRGGSPSPRPPCHESHEVPGDGEGDGETTTRAARVMSAQV